MNHDFHVEHSHSRGTSLASGQWYHDVRVPCRHCGAVTALTGILPDETGVVYMATHEDLLTLQRRVEYKLETRGVVVYQQIHVCSMNQHPTRHSDVEIKALLLDIRQQLADRRHESEELRRLTGLVEVLTDKVNWVEAELETAQEKVRAYERQLIDVHNFLDCPCEMELIDVDSGLNLLAHLEEMDHG